MSSSLNAHLVEEADSRISNLIHKTPILTSSTLDEICAKKLYFKCENFQKTGSFKIRGFLNAILKAKESGHLKGVITMSAGNGGQSLAYSASKVGVPSIVAVPETVSITKADAIVAYGAELQRCPPNITILEETCEKLAKDLGYYYVDPHSDYEVMAGHGTVVKEFLEQAPDLDALLVQVGGGGLIAGVAKYVAEVNPKIKVFCIEPEGKDLQSSLNAQVPLWEDTSKMLNTIADGLMVQRVTEQSFQVINECCQKRTFSVNNQEISNAMLLIMQRLKVVIEPSAALGLAAVLKYREELKDCHKIGIILTGGNADLNKLPF
uniref:Tryptophan synthase beta chain-like PALP domain-containing protein n=1 Tax=Acrobeloides nanus TaxID=290746 RepID=A0A914DSK0_9BILA